MPKGNSMLTPTKLGYTALAHDRNNSLLFFVDNGTQGVCLLATFVLRGHLYLDCAHVAIPLYLYIPYGIVTIRISFGSKKILYNKLKKISQ